MYTMPSAMVEEYSAGHDSAPTTGAWWTERVDRMKGFDDSTYGDAFADVYDDWYDDVSDVGATVALVHELAAGGSVLELGVGTGRLAIPLAQRGCRVVGIDSSAAMLRACAAKQGDVALSLIHGDMVDDLPSGPFAAALIAYNTIFSLPTPERQGALFAAVAERLAPSGALVVEAAVPDPQRKEGGTVGVRSMHADRVVLSIDVHHPDEQRVDGQFVELSESGGVRLRPWSIRYTTPAELDAMASRAGLRLTHRWEDTSRSPFVSDSPTHVSVYTR